MRRMFVEEEIQAEAEVAPDLEDDIEDLQQILALGPKEAREVVGAATSGAYKCAPSPWGP